MAQSALEVGNAALYKLGATTVSSVTGADESNEGLVLTARLEICKRSLLRMHPWNFATKRKIITPPTAVTLTTPFVEYVSANTIKFTVASHSFVATDYLTSLSTGTVEGEGTFEVASVTATTVTCTAPGVTALTGTPAAGTIRLSPAFEFSYLYTLPSDLLRLLTINEQVQCPSWRVEGRKILSNTDVALDVKYIYDVTDYTAMDVHFYECLAHYIAWDVCEKITGDDEKKRALWTDLHGGDGKVGMLPRGRFSDAAEDSLQRMQTDDWTGSRVGFMPETDS